MTLVHPSTLPPPESGERASRLLRRTSRRSPLHARVDIVHPIAASGVTINVSDGGLRIAIDTVLEADRLCTVRITDSAGRERTRHARVAWTRWLRDGCIAGLAWVDRH